MSTAEPNGDRRAMRAQELMQIAEALRQAILSQDVKGILHYVGAKGIFCIDDFVELGKFKRDLNDPQSPLYANLFGPGGIKDNFEKAKDQKIRVDFMELEGKENLDSACLRYMSSNYDAADWPEICVSFRDAKWGINNSLYNCG